MDIEEENLKVLNLLKDEVSSDIMEQRVTALPFAKKAAKASTKDKYSKLCKLTGNDDFDVQNHIEHKIYVLKYKLKHVAYHGGKFNGVHCRKILAEGYNIMDEIKAT
jgi:hypothetical protein